MADTSVLQRPTPEFIRERRAENQKARARDFAETLGITEAELVAALREAITLPDAPKIAMLTASEEDDQVMQALKAGALGYVLKGVGARELVGIVKDLARGQTYVSPVLAGRLLASMRNGGAARPANPLADLSKREEDILRLVAEGKSNKEIGLTLDLQEKTVKHYMTNILQKLQVRNRVEAALKARDLGL